jgi:adenylyltransferase/sulfurtransferase
VRSAVVCECGEPAPPVLVRVNATVPTTSAAAASAAAATVAYVRARADTTGDDSFARAAIFSKAMSSYRDFLQEAKGQIDEVDAERAHELHRSGAPPVFLDVREREEWDEGHLPAATHIPRGWLESRIEQAVPDRARPIVIYCASGSRSAFAAKTLEELGYQDVASLAGGIDDWKRHGYPLEVPRGALTGEQRTRYSRHLLIPEVGEEGQQRLLQSRILLIGAGGLGSPAALYLAAAGIGTLGIVDADVVDETNLQRQILHSTATLGEPKVESAARALRELNPDVNVKTYREQLTSENVDRILDEGWDVIVDGADNFPTRYLVNDAAVFHDIALVHGSIFRFEGQATVFKPHQGPCYRCLFPQPPPPELAPSCAEGGVLGVLPGVIGSLQANEAIKLALGIGDPLIGRLLLFDAQSTTFTDVALRKDPDCPVCGEHPTITEYVDYVEFCNPVRV